MWYLMNEQAGNIPDMVHGWTTSAPSLLDYGYAKERGQVFLTEEQAIAREASIKTGDGRVIKLTPTRHYSLAVRIKDRLAILRTYKSILSQTFKNRYGFVAVFAPLFIFAHVSPLRQNV